MPSFIGPKTAVGQKKMKCWFFKEKCVAVCTTQYVCFALFSQPAVADTAGRQVCCVHTPKILYVLGPEIVPMRMAISEGWMYCQKNQHGQTVVQTISIQQPYFVHVQCRTYVFREQFAAAVLMFSGWTSSAMLPSFSLSFIWCMEMPSVVLYNICLLVYSFIRHI